MPYIGRSSDFGIRTVFHFLASNGDTSVSGADVDGKHLSFAEIVGVPGPPPPSGVTQVIF